MSALNISIDLGHLIPPDAGVDKSFPHLAFAVRKITERGLGIWQGYASGAPLPGGEIIHSRSGRYMRSIQEKSTGPFSSEIYSELPYAKGIERGMPARDMKKMLDSSSKVRISKKGKRYLIIPFRHGTPGSNFRNVMPVEVHEMWRGMKSSRVTGQRHEVSATGAIDIKTRRPARVSRRTYKWGDRMKAEQLLSAGVTGRKMRHMEGMVNFKSQDGGHSSYMTFRVMSEGSSGWLAKARAGYFPAKATADRIRPEAEKAFTEAVKYDVSQYLSR